MGLFSNEVLQSILKTGHMRSFHSIIISFLPITQISHIFLMFNINYLYCGTTLFFCLFGGDKWLKTFYAPIDMLQFNELMKWSITNKALIGKIMSVKVRYVSKSHKSINLLVIHSYMK